MPKFDRLVYVFRTTFLYSKDYNGYICIYVQVESILLYSMIHDILHEILLEMNKNNDLDVIINIKTCFREH